MLRDAFEGKVTAEVIPHATVRETIIRQGFIRAVPEAVTFDDQYLKLFNNVILIVGRVKSLAFQNGETDANITALSEFWRTAHGSPNYRQVWENYLDLPSLDINNELMNNIINPPTEDDILRAPIEIRPYTPTDEQLEDMGEQGNIFLARAGNI